MKKIKYLLQFVLIGHYLFNLTGCVSDKENLSPIPGEEYLTIANDGAWCWFSDPRAVYFEGEYSRTYAGWIDSKGNVTVGYYDHGSRNIQTHIVHPELEIDDHDNPSLFIDDKGFIYVFYSKHSGREPLYMMKSEKPEEITGWNPREDLKLNDTIAYPEYSNTYTYSNIVQLSEENNKLYLFWRGADFKPNFSTSDDMGKTWSKGKILILPDRIYSNRRPYMKVSSNGENTIHFAFTDGHPRNEPTNSIYYARYRDNSLQKADGTKIKNWAALPLQPENADRVYDAKETGERAWIWDVAETATGNPVLVYARFPNNSAHVYYYAIFHNNKWNNYRLVNSGGWFPETPEGEIEREPNYSGGIVVDHEDPSIVYLSREKEGVFEIEKWQTKDFGQSWAVEEITTNSTYDNIRPFVIRNYNQEDSMRVLWMNVRRYVHYTEYKGDIKLEARSWKLEGGKKLEARSWKLEGGSWKLEGGIKLEARSRKLEAGCCHKKRSG